MPALPLNPEQISDAQRLRALFKKFQDDRKDRREQFSQEWASGKLGFNQSALNQYLNGRIPLNPDAASKFAELLRCEVADFSPMIAASIRDLSRTVKTVREPGIVSPDEGEPAHSTVQKDSKTSVFIEDGTDPMQSMPTLGSTMLHLAALLAAVTPLGRKSIAPLLASVIDDPDSATSAAKMADAIAASQHIETRNPEVSRLLNRSSFDPVETNPSPLGRK